MDKFRILIVDDSKTIHSEIKSAIKNLVIENKGVLIDDVYGYEEFKSAYEPNKYALVMTDLVMEEEDWNEGNKLH